MAKSTLLSLDKRTLRLAALDGVKKMHPGQLWHNPVMMTVLVGTLVTLALLLQQLCHGAAYGLSLATSLILLLTLWFAGFAEAIAEAGSRGQTASLRSARGALQAFRLSTVNNIDTLASAAVATLPGQMVAATTLHQGEWVRVSEGQDIPVDGEILWGVATVNESAVTGESAAVLREAGSDRSGVIGGTRLLSGMLVIQVANEPGHSFLDRMIGLVEGAKRQKTPNETALTVLLSALTCVFVLVVISLPPMAAFLGAQLDYTMLVALLVCLIPTTIGGLLPAIGIAGMNRALAANVVAKSGKAVEVAGDIDTLLLDKTGTITFGDRQAREFIPCLGRSHEALVQAAVLCSLKDPTPEGKSVLVLAESTIRELPESAQFMPFSPQTQVSGVQLADGSWIIKGAADAVRAWAEPQGLPWPSDIDSKVSKVAREGGTPLVVATSAQLLGVIALQDVIKPGVAERFARLRALGVRTVMVTGDNPVTAGVIAAAAGVDDFVAQAKPEDKLALIRREQANGHLVAMVGDGTNDAPALAQADVGLAMNSGTQAAKEAGNMVDLDSDPAKLLAMVEIGKQLLMTRGALTTFSLANDVAKYFVIIPAVFAGVLPSIAMLDILQLHSPASAVLSALLFNGLIIPALIPLALKGITLKVQSAEQLLRHNLLLFGVGGLLLPFVAIKAIDLLLSPLF